MMKSQHRYVVAHILLSFEHIISDKPDDGHCWPKQVVVICNKTSVTRHTLVVLLTSHLKAVWEIRPFLVGNSTIPARL